MGVGGEGLVHWGVGLGLSPGGLFDRTEDVVLAEHPCEQGAAPFVFERQWVVAINGSTSMTV